MLSTTFITGNDSRPKTDIEIFYAFCVNFMGMLIYAKLFGELALVVEQINLRSNALQDKIDTANTAMKNMKLPKEIQDQVIEFIKAT